VHRGVRLLLIAVVWGAAATAALADPAAVTLSALAHPRTGWVGVALSAPAGSTVTLSEVVAGVAAPFSSVTMTASEQTIPRALPWRCDRRTRRLRADAVAPGGASSSVALTVRTPSCADRFSVRFRPRTAVRVGRPLKVTVRDRWRTGAAGAQVCLRVHGAASCRAADVPGGGHAAVVRLAVARPGLASLALTAAGFTRRERLEARRPRARLRLLATGDSMIQIIDSLLAQRLGHGARVTADAHISTGLSKPFMFDWLRHARGETARVRPEATVMFIGANDGFPIGRARCCDAAWIAAYAKRVTALMRDFRRGGAGRVYWLTIPAPRDAQRRRIYAAINRAIERAAGAFERDEVSVIDLVPVFTPGGRFRASIHGRVVRQADGIHLNVAGARIAARLIAARLRADGLA
jgi:lysophospholipase L1-like esterase